MKPLIKEMLQDVLVFDIETSAIKNGVPINIRTDFDSYVEHAKVKWVGAYSYKHNEYYDLNVYEDEEQIKTLFKEHKTLVGFNSKEFDYPIMKNNGLLDKHYYTNLDLMLILGSDNYKHGFKQRAVYMGVKLKDNSLRTMAKSFKLETLKGDIDYKIFFKEQWSFEETSNIKKYLRGDVEVTKQLFDKTIEFWELFTGWLNEADVKKWVWINSSIASLTYTCSCKTKNKPVTFSNDTKDKEDMGGRAVNPPYEEVFGAHYMDETSKYPHLFSEFNLFSEINVEGQPQWKIDKLIQNGMLWHGNEMFKVKGYYDIRQHGVLEKDLINKLKTRFAIKKLLKQHSKGQEIVIPDLIKPLIPEGVLTDEILTKLKGLEYAIKIYANALYGVVRSSTFEQLSTPNAGYDCCWLGQQIHEYLHKAFENKGWEVIGGFTDSWFVKTDGVSEEEILKFANDVLNILKQHIPFPEETHTVGYECFIDTIIYSYDDKKGEYKKNNYAFIANGKVKIVGFPIMKSNASKLAIHIFDTYLRPEAIKHKRLKFKKGYVEELIKQELNNNITLSAVTVKCNEFKSYKNASQLQAQVSRAYLSGLSGEVTLIKNKKYGKVGIGEKYCTLEEAFDNDINFKDLVLDKVWNELEPFILKEKMVSLGDFM